MPNWRAQRASVDWRTSQARSTVSSPSADSGPQLVQTMGDDDAEHGIAQELESFVGFEAAARPLVHIGGVDERRLQKRRIAERVAERPVERTAPRTTSRASGGQASKV